MTITELTPEQQRSYTRLSTSIADAFDEGKPVPCVRLPGFFDLSLAKPRVSGADDEQRARELARRRELRAIRLGLCRRCPVLEQCTDYASTGVQVYGFLAGAWRNGEQ